MLDNLGFVKREVEGVYGDLLDGSTIQNLGLHEDDGIVTADGG